MKKLLFIFWMLSMPSYSFAEKVLIVYEPYPPYEFVENGKIIGMDADIVREVCNRLNLVPEFREVPWKRALHEVETGKADAIFSLFNTEERAKYLHFPSENLFFEKNVIIARQDSDLKIAKLEDLNGKKIGVVSGNSYGTAFDAYQGMIRDESDDYDMLLRKLDAKRTELGILNELVFSYMTNKDGQPKDRFKKLEYIPSNEPLYIGFSKAIGERGKKLAEQFERVLKQLREEGVVQKIMQKY